MNVEVVVVVALKTQLLKTLETINYTITILIIQKMETETFKENAQLHLQIRKASV